MKREREPLTPFADAVLTLHNYRNRLRQAQATRKTAHWFTEVEQYGPHHDEYERIEVDNEDVNFFVRDNHYLFDALYQARYDIEQGLTPEPRTMKAIRDGTIIYELSTKKAKEIVNEKQKRQDIRSQREEEENMSIEDEDDMPEDDDDMMHELEHVELEEI